jgi:hypothetical protein
MLIRIVEKSTSLKLGEVAAAQTRVASEVCRRRRADAVAAAQPDLAGRCRLTQGFDRAWFQLPTYDDALLIVAFNSDFGLSA